MWEDPLKLLRDQFQAKKEKEGEMFWKSAGFWLITFALFCTELIFLSVSNVLYNGNWLAGTGAVFGSIGSVITAGLLILAKVKYIRSGTWQERFAWGFLVLDLIVFGLNIALARELMNQPNTTLLNPFFAFWFSACSSVPIVVEVVGWLAVLLSDPEKERLDLRSDAKRKKENMDLTHDLARHKAEIESAERLWQREEEQRIETEKLKEARDKADMELRKAQQEAEIALNKEKKEVEIQKIRAEIERQQLEIQRTKELDNLKHTFEKTKLQATLEFQQEAMQRQLEGLVEELAEYQPEIGEAKKDFVIGILEEVTGKHIARYRKPIPEEDMNVTPITERRGPGRPRGRPRNLSQEQINEQKLS